MSTLLEIETAAGALSQEEQQQLLLYLASLLRANGDLPKPREFSAEQIAGWIAEDESDMRRFTDDK